MNKEEFDKWYKDVADSLDDFFKLTNALRESENNNIKTITWFEYESL